MNRLKIEIFLISEVDFPFSLKKVLICDSKPSLCDNRERREEIRLYRKRNTCRLIAQKPILGGQQDSLWKG